VTFLGWTRLHATWIKPEVVATKKYTGYLHYRFITIGSMFSWSPCCSYMWFFLVFVWPCQLFVRLYRVSDVLDLSLLSKRFGFWPHKKKRNTIKRKRQKEERTSVPRPLSWNIYAKKQCRHINRAGYNNVCELIDSMLVSFRDIRGHLGTIISIVTFLYMRLS
jgi:hypothetical protein